MSSKLSRILVLVTALVVTLSYLVSTDAEASRRKILLTFDGAAVAGTLAAQAADTSETKNFGTCDGASWMVAFEGDSCLVTVQGSYDETNWYSLASYQCNGTDGTYAMQWAQQYTVTTLAAKNDTSMPPPTFVRVIVNNNDKHDDAGVDGSDAIGALRVYLNCDKW